ncbi:MAG: DNA replication/repair protein RecF [Cucumibacter sp.]
MTDRTPPQRHISRLRLHAFRNYPTAALDLDSRHVVLTGENGAGKTNLLEAISLLSPGRGLRRANFEDLPIHGGDGAWAIAATVEGSAAPVDIGTGLAPGGGDRPRRVRINGADARLVEELGEHLRILWITPSMDGLFSGPAAERRHFFDRLVSTLIPGHGAELNAYERAMRQRNRLLTENPDSEWLNAIETEMAAHAAAIHFARTDTLAHLAALFRATTDTAFPSALVELTGLADFESASVVSTALEGAYLDIWKKARNVDRAAARTTIGPHRIDVVVTHVLKRIPAKLCSTGEQKALLVNLVLAHAKLVGQMTGMTPILLLDEIAAHLDAARRRALYQRLDRLGTQCWLTGTDPQLFEPLGNSARRFTVAHGKLAPAG